MLRLEMQGTMITKLIRIHGKIAEGRQESHHHKERIIIPSLE